jgi:4-hydroxybenzoate polyprenyltransferase
LTGRRLRVVLAYFRLPHAVPILVVMATTAAFATIAADGLPGARDFADLLLAMLCAQLLIGTVNELVDAETDALVKPAKPIPAGLVTARGARLLAGISLVGMVWFSSRLGWRSLALCSLGTAVGVSYSIWFKRSLLAWLPYLIALPLLPIWVFTATTGFDARLLMLYPLGAFAVLGVHLSQSLPDVAADQASGVCNPTSRLGERMAFLLCLGSMLSSVFIAIVAAATWTDSTSLVAIAGGVVLVLVVADAGAYLRHPRFGVMACFPCVATGTATLGIAWALAVTR